MAPDRLHWRAGADALNPPPDASQPRLLFEWQSGRAIVVVQLQEAGRDQIASPCFEVVVRAIALAAPAFLIPAARIGGEEHATRLERRIQLAQDSGELLTGHMEQDGVGEYSVETLWR